MDLKLGIVKGTHKLLSLFGRGGSLPGSIALKLDKDFIKRFKMPEIVILVTGTYCREFKSFWIKSNQ